MFRRILLAIVLAAGLGIPQEVESTLTNRDVSAMLKAKLAESTIQRVIALMADRGMVQFDTSAPALIDLKNQGATAGVLDAMLYAETLPKRVLPSTTVPGLPIEQGVYYRTGDRWGALASSLVWPEIYTHWRGMNAIEDRRYAIPGAVASLRVNEATPTFDVRGTSPNGVWQLIRLDVKRNYREWRTAPTDVFRYPFQEPRQARAEPQMALKVVAHDVFELRPTAALEPGQYALAMIVQGQHWLVMAYEFAVGGGH